MDGIRVPSSVYIDGQWFEAQWLAEVADESTGELIITATVAGPGAPVVAALRMDMALARKLRAMAMDGSDGLDGAEAFANREWMDETERRLDALEKQQREQSLVLVSHDQRLEASDALNLGGRLDFLSKQFLKTMERVDAGLPGAEHMRGQYDPENDADLISYWDMQLLNMIETVNDRLGAAVGGA